MAFSADKLAETNFPPPNWVVKELLPEGVTLLVGKPKTRKSFLALNIGLAVASGRAVLTLPTKRGTVLCISLEDNYRRLKSRLNKCCPENPPTNLHFETAWPRLDHGGIEKIHDWVVRNPDTNLIIIDTLAKVWPDSQRAGKGKTLYHQDYDFMSILKKISDDYGVAILAVHHMKKGEYEDPTDAPSGSAGLSGGADTLITIRRVRTEDTALLFVTGKDIENERSDSIQFDRPTCTWKRLGSGDILEQTPERGDLLSLLDAAGDAMETAEIAGALGKSTANISKMLKPLVESGRVVRIKKGLYQSKPKQPKKKSGGGASGRKRKKQTTGKEGDAGSAGSSHGG